MDNKKEYITILFNGFGSSKIFWKYAFENKPLLRKIDFLDKLKNISKIYSFNLPFFNLNYYSRPNNKKDKVLWKKIYDKYHPHSSDINFLLEDLDYKKICEKVYNSVKQKYGDNKKYIVIGHSYGGSIALLFSKLYKKECDLCCCIDNPPHVLSFYNKHNDKQDKDIIKKYPNNNALKKSINIIKNSNNIKEKNNLINDIYKLISYKSCQDRIKYYNKKLYVPTVFFRLYYSNPVSFQKDWNKYSKEEKKLFENDKNMINYIIMKDLNHFMWYDQKCSDKIIETIRQKLF
jgi:hypothetical protein